MWIIKFWISTGLSLGFWWWRHNIGASKHIFKATILTELYNPFRCSFTLYWHRRLSVTMNAHQECLTFALTHSNDRVFGASSCWPSYIQSQSFCDMKKMSLSIHPSIHQADFSCILEQIMKAARRHPQREFLVITCPVMSAGFYCSPFPQKTHSGLLYAESYLFRWGCECGSF